MFALIPEMQVSLEYTLFTGIPKTQKKVLEGFHYFIPPYKGQDKADLNYTTQQSQHRPAFLSWPP